MDKEKVSKKWLAAFAAGVDEKFMEEHVLSSGNYLWHMFSWEAVPCLVGDEARKAFNEQAYDEAIIFESGFSWSEDGLSCQAEASAIENLRVIGKIMASDLEECDDVYVVAKDFSWTYVHTHEEMCGPYFLKTADKQYDAEARSKYGDDIVDESNRKLTNMSEDDSQKFKELEAEILERLETAVENGITQDSEEVRKIVELHKNWLCMAWTHYDTKMHRGVAAMYVADERFKKYYDRNVQGCAKLLNKAVQFWVK